MIGVTLSPGNTTLEFHFDKTIEGSAGGGVTPFDGLIVVTFHAEEVGSDEEGYVTYFITD